jgi:hypothetical protein
MEIFLRSLLFKELDKFDTHSIDLAEMILSELYDNNPMDTTPVLPRAYFSRDYGSL